MATKPVTAAGGFDIEGYVFNTWVDRDLNGGRLGLYLEESVGAPHPAIELLDKLIATAPSPELAEKVRGVRDSIADGDRDVTWRLPPDAIQTMGHFIGKNVRLSIRVEELPDVEREERAPIVGIGDETASAMQ